MPAVHCVEKTERYLQKKVKRDSVRKILCLKPFLMNCVKPLFFLWNCFVILTFYFYCA